MHPHEQDFLDMTINRNKETLLLLADRALSAFESILDEMVKNEADDAYEFRGSMNDVEDAREAMHRYKGYLITGQK